MKQTHHQLLFLLLGLIFGGLLIAWPAKTEASYNPNNILRDELFLNVNAMDQTSIQNFLASKGSCLANVDPSLLSSDQSAAWLIADGARNAYNLGLNPQVILVTLQKEWSLITKSCADLDALYGGYSGGPQVYLKRALGYNVPDVLGIGSCLYSFNAQMRGNTCDDGERYLGGPGSMRKAYANNTVGPSGNYPFPTAFSVQEYSDRAGNITITPKTRATSVLFRYTPFAYYGNFNFYNLWLGWFGSPACGPNLRLIKGVGSSAIYALKEGTKFHLPSYDVVLAWGLDCLPVEELSDSEVVNYRNGDPITRVFKELEGPRVFIANGTYRRHIRASNYVVAAGLGSEHVSHLPSYIWGELDEGPPVGFLTRPLGQPDTYLSLLNRKYYIPDVATIESWGFTLSEVVEVNSTYLDQLPNAGTLTVLVKGSGPEIYVASNRRFLWIPSLQRVRDWNLQNFGVTLIDDQLLEILPRVGQLTQVTKGSGAGIYFITSNRRYHLATLTAFSRYNGRYGPSVGMADSLIGRVPLVGAYR